MKLPVRYLFIALIFCNNISAAAIFDQVRSQPVNERRHFASEIYHSKIKGLDSLHAFNMLKQLLSLSKELNDPVLECLYHELKADYYCVYYRANPYSFSHYQRAADIAALNNMPGYQAMYIFKQGDYYFTLKEYTDAYRYFLQAFDLFKKIGYEKIPDIEYHFRTISSFFYTLGDMESTEYYLKESMQLKNADPIIRIDIQNTLGMVHRNKGQYDKAMQYFISARENADASGHKDWPYITRGNIGSIYLLQGKYAEALPYLRIDYEGSIRNGDSVNAGPAMLRIATVSMMQNNIPLAFRQLDSMETTLKKSQVLTQLSKYYMLKSQLYEKSGQTAQALLYRKKYDSMLDSINKKHNLLVLDRMKMKWETENYYANISKLESMAATERIKRNSILIVLVLLIIFAMVFFSRQKLMRQRERELLENQKALLRSENERKAEELQNAKTQMLNYTENIKQKNDMIELFKKEMDTLQHTLADNQDHEARAAQFDKLIQSNLMTGESWDEFRNIFNKLYKDFYSQLKSKYNNLNETDIRLCSLIKLKLSNREMATMLGITIDGVKKAKQRLRKKIDSPENITIEEIVEMV